VSRLSPLPPLQSLRRPPFFWRPLWQKLREGGALMVGVPDYERYLAHMRARHPEHPPLGRKAFLDNRMQARYGGSKAGKCPC
jgi:uncharacterized short protein YbdD (DUF466 family)